MIDENTLNFIRFSSGFNNLKKEELKHLPKMKSLNLMNTTQVMKNKENTFTLYYNLLTERKE